MRTQPLSVLSWVVAIVLAVLGLALAAAAVWAGVTGEGTGGRSAVARRAARAALTGRFTRPGPSG